MKKLSEMTYKEGAEFEKLLEAWLGTYTEEVTKKVYPKLEEIYNNELVMHMLRELKERQEKEQKSRTRTFGWILSDAQQGKEWQDHYIHNYCLEHSSAYRNVLYDMYIAGK